MDLYVDSILVFFIDDLPNLKVSQTVILFLALNNMIFLFPLGYLTRNGEAHTHVITMQPN